MFTMKKNKSVETTSAIKKPLLGAILVAMPLLHAPVVLAEKAGGNAQYSLGLSIGSQGVGASVAGKTPWSLKEGDQIQWRLVVSSADIDFDSDDDIELSDIDYNDGSLSMFGVQTGLDWYPASHGWADEVFISAGLMYSDLDLDANADLSKNFSVGNAAVRPGDIDKLNAKVEHSGVRPYVSLGWGNKLSAKRGFDFHTEIGVTFPTSDADVKITANDPSGFLSAADLAAERKDLEDDFSGPVAFFSAAVTYQF